MTGQVYVFPASYAQRGLWFLDQLTPGSSLYNIQVGIRISSAVNVPRLEWSINEIVRRHESLRTTFKAVDGEPVQLVHPEVHIQLRLTDLSELTEPQREEAALLIATE
jgi:Condensation domain